MMHDGFEELSILREQGPSDKEKNWTRSRTFLLNKLNYLHFDDQSFCLHFRHRSFDRLLALEVTNDPCEQSRLRCFWVKEGDRRHELSRYTFESLSFQDHAGRTITAYPRLLEVFPDGVLLELPDRCNETVPDVLIHEGRDVQTLVYQSAAVFQGQLLAFRAEWFKVRVQAEPPQTFKWISLEQPVHLVLKDGNHTYFSGECRISEYSGDSEFKELELEPVKRTVQRFQARKYRSSRTALLPNPDVFLRHPLSKQTLYFKAVDLSGSGLALAENLKTSSLFAGLVIPELKIIVHANLRLTCSVQVIHKSIRTGGDTQAGQVVFGLCFLDMDLQEHTALLSLLQQVRDQRASLDGPVDNDELWSFFFEAGFVYPKKYLLLQNKKQDLKQIYRRLYAEHAPISKHFLYRENGAIWAHMSMLRFYNRAWLIHHNAANNRQGKMGGVRVLDQISRYVNEIHTLDSSRMDYVFCYFRPENKFSERVFGGMATALKDPQKCSRDTFAYVLNEKLVVANALPEEWSLTPVSQEDLLEFWYFYQAFSGGLLARAFDLHPRAELESGLVAEYQHMGFDRNTLLYALKFKGQLKVLILVSTSVPGLNMSDLTNCIKIFIMDRQDLNRRIFWSMVSEVESRIEDASLPVLVYPLHSLQELSINYDKMYSLWIFNLQYLDAYFQYCENLFKKL